MQQVTEEKIVAKLREHLTLSKAIMSPLATVFNKHTYPPPPNKLSTCTHNGKQYDPNYILLDSKHLCKVESQVG